MIRLLNDYLCEDVGCKERVTYLFVSDRSGGRVLLCDQHAAAWQRELMLAIKPASPKN